MRADGATRRSNLSCTNLALGVANIYTNAVAITTPFELALVRLNTIVVPHKNPIVIVRTNDAVGRAAAGTVREPGGAQVAGVGRRVVELVEGARDLPDRRVSDAPPEAIVVVLEQLERLVVGGRSSTVVATDGVLGYYEQIGSAGSGGGIATGGLGTLEQAVAVLTSYDEGQERAELTVTNISNSRVFLGISIKGYFLVPSSISSDLVGVCEKCCCVIDNTRVSGAIIRAVDAVDVVGQETRAAGCARVGSAG